MMKNLSLFRLKLLLIKNSSTQIISALVIILLFSQAMVSFGQSVGINADGSTPNANAMLEIKSPESGNGKGLLIPRVTEAQRTTASSKLDGGLLNDSGELRGGAAQGLLVYQTDGDQGFYYNISADSTPTWSHIGNKVTNSVPDSRTLSAGEGLSGGGDLTEDRSFAVNVDNATLEISTDALQVKDNGISNAKISAVDAGKITSGTLAHQRGGLGADVSAYNGLVKITGGATSAVTVTGAGEALLDDADAASQRTTLGLGSIATQSIPYSMPTTNGSNGQYLATNGSGTAAWSTVSVPLPGTTIAIGDSTTATGNGIAVGVQANSKTSGTAIGYRSNSSYYGAALGYKANGNDCNVAMGYSANAYTGGGPYCGSVSLGYRANSYSGDGKYTGGVAIGYTANARHNFNENDSGAVAVGFKANSFIRGAGVGYKAAGYNQGVAVGYLSTGSNSGIGIGYKANGYSSGTAIGYMANAGNRKYSFAKGAYSKCTRYNEEWKASDGYNNKFGYGQVNWYGTTTTGAPAREIYLGGSSGQRFILQDKSAVTFQILVTGVNTDTNETSGWRIWGVIERRSGANTTALVGAVTIDAKTQGDLNTNPTVSADTTNGALKLAVTGVAGEDVRWNAMMTYSEVRE